MSKKIYNDIQQQIIEMLESSLKLEFQQSWFSPNNMAKNPITNSFYTGFNQLYLSFITTKKQFEVNKWVTFNQATQLKANIIKGEKATPVIYYNFIYKNDKGENLSLKQVQSLVNSTGKSLTELKISRNGFLRFYFVFNVAQINGLPTSFYVPDDIILTQIEKEEQAETILRNSNANIEHKLIDEAFYSPASDLITLPLMKQFVDQQKYYSTAFHELSHWTGAAHRLNRTFGKKFGDNEYAFEELVAELSAALICGSIGIAKDFTNNAAYIKSWICAFKKDINVFFRAAAHAQKSADYILSYQINQHQAA
ncbi:MAG: DUF1738 domain-containing protein [Flavobacteriales bacterium]|nr:DUF1738 domain-containing protein [Flavobacteriales bacterium]